MTSVTSNMYSFAASAKKHVTRLGSQIYLTKNVDVELGLHEAAILIIAAIFGWYWW